MNTLGLPMIAGAGPVGLGAALFLARLGHATRVIEERHEPARESKALAVNPRTLEILEATGVTERMLAFGLPIRGALLHRGEKVVAHLSFEGLHPKYPYMLALSQATTERLLAQALEAAGGSVERGVRLVACRNQNDSVEATLESTEGNARAVVACPWLLAADGAHSTARATLGVAFPGSSFPDEWHLADVPLRTALAADHAHAFLTDDGFLFLIRMVDPALADQPAPLWRIIGNRPQPLTCLLQAEVVGAPVWVSSFRISHRLNSTLAEGRVYFAGDSGHVHSPMGARGMNLGLEDAWVFATLVHAGQLERYDSLWRAVDHSVVRQVELLSRIVNGGSWLTRFARSALLPAALRLPSIRRRMIWTLSGLDHPLPADLLNLAQIMQQGERRGVCPPADRSAKLRRAARPVA
jgi:2-polyprenyl-6-methoxyphenol hydroxylase-like FAD-dependent oxidoreductase